MTTCNIVITWHICGFVVVDIALHAMATSTKSGRESCVLLPHRSVPLHLACCLKRQRIGKLHPLFASCLWMWSQTWTRLCPFLCDCCWPALMEQKRGYKDQWPYSVRIYKDDASGKPKGDCIIKYEEATSAHAALKVLAVSLLIPHFIPQLCQDCFGALQVVASLSVAPTTLTRVRGSVINTNCS